ncbi:hypothetical protein LEP1GSC034_1236 [Leptospira interrogans str. 2003000735]|nr:hypothetical protein LEP1GSC027_4097 [Leptospira interrogans str. 2002000624]EKQ39896.1 hypothetical protein LEP1GSC025_1063 [Leptospira interrogans str. 2002000621]EMJ69155.1 hypothetical protein LEP1GSC033_2084 [Leptospira interrogans str. 2002000632]EMJ73507.1 hypothetical protein LEP1GSC034_1236 [Leptospira interrogans str. 2003000735]EMJ81130.1 hypothetical protein LEP1GSC032_2083 [Leptospira interrogans str. 2002000631]
MKQNKMENSFFNNSIQINTKHKISIIHFDSTILKCGNSYKIEQD